MVRDLDLWKLVTFDKTVYIYMWVFPKMVGFSPKSSILIGFSIIKFILFGGTPIFGNTHVSIHIPWEVLGHHFFSPVGFRVSPLV